MPEIKPAPSFVNLLARFTPGQTVFLPGLTGESLGLYTALQQQPQAAAGLKFTGVHFPGINQSDYLALAPDTRFHGYFMTPALRSGLVENRVSLMPLDYPGIYQDLSHRVDVDIAVFQVSPPDENGLCSPGISLDFQTAVWKKAAFKVAHINPLMPRTHAAWNCRLDDFDAVVECESPLINQPMAEPDSDQMSLAANVAALVRDGDTVQFGVGKLPTAVTRALSGHNRLKINSGMITPAVAELVDSAVVESVETGVALGDSDFYARVAEDERYRFRPVCQTHDLARLSAIQAFCSINSAVEVDLFGQVNAESLGGRLVAGVGGLPVYVQAARRSSGGRSIICLPAQTGGGKRAPKSRIVPQLNNGGMTAVPRHGVDYVVTEHGSVRLSGLDVMARAKALIGIAAPEQRPALHDAWQQILQRL